MRDDERVLWEEGNPPEKEKERKENKKNGGEEEEDMRVQNRFRWSRFGLHPRYQARKLN